MEQMEFNLLRENWIRVMLPDCSVVERSLTDALLNAQDYRCLAGEMPTQDMAVLRLMLAVLHTVFSRVDEHGRPAPLENGGEALRRWKALWDRGSLPPDVIGGYLDQWAERFWLFHPTFPFYQVPAAEAGTEYTAAKLNGELSESSNKARLFPMRTGAARHSLTYGEAARWLVTINGFDDSSTKVGTGTGSGWLGQLGNVYAEGKNLFETLLLNLILLKDGSALWEEEENPYWEQSARMRIDKREISLPENQSALLTLQSRRLILLRENDKVVGYHTAGGDYFSSVDAFSEQFSLWRNDAWKKNKKRIESMPKRHDPARQMWRDFNAIVLNNDNEHRPGIVSWIFTLQRQRYLPRGTFCLRAVGMRYDGKGSSVLDVFSDHLDFHTALLDDAGAYWVKLIQQQIGMCEQAAVIVGHLADGLCKAGGGDRASQAQYAREQFFSRVDAPFRQWLLAIDPNADDDAASREQAEIAWRKTAYDIARRLGAEMVDQSGDAAFAGRNVTEKIKGKTETRFYSAPKAYNSFLYRIRQCFDMKAIEEGSHG